MTDRVTLYAFLADDREVAAVITGPDKLVCEQAAKDCLCSEYVLTFEADGLAVTNRTNYVQL